MTSGNTVRIDFHSSLGMLDFVQMVDGDCELDAGWITYLPAYEAVHRENLAAVGAM